jgi:DNA-binding transcriptional LysR family regulator
LRYFLVVGEEEHFGRAAERLHVSQSAVSQVTRRLERELGVQLFERRGRGVTLTAAGRFYYASTTKLFADHQQSIELTKRSARGEIGHLRVAHDTHASWDPLIIESIRLFREAHPAVHIELHAMNTWQQSRALEAARIDAGFQHPVRSEPGFEYCQIRLARRGIAFAEGHPILQKRGAVHLADLAQEGFVTLPLALQGPGYDALIASCLAAGFEPRIVQEADTATMLLNLVLGRVGITFMSWSGAERFPPGLVVRRVRGLDLWQRICLAWRSKDLGNPSLAHFVATVRGLVERKTAAGSRARVNRTSRAR